MIVAQIIGGLGNQMFQYAAARALSIARGEELGLDTSAFDDYPLHQGFELRRVFGIAVPEVSHGELRRRYGWRISQLAMRLGARWRHFPLVNPRIVIEPHFDFWSGLVDVPAASYLRGYWQSERYFGAYHDVIRADFRFAAPLDGAAKSWAESILSENAVSMHVRRGDYVSNPVTLAVHGVCALDYYVKAVEAVATRVRNPVFYVFSDDLQWVRENLALAYPVRVVDVNTGKASYRDLQLMSMCKHNIIANSSFSWWGAWLNANPDKVVVAPSRWFANGPQPRDIYPVSWVAL